MSRGGRESEAERVAIDRAAQDLVSRGLALWSTDGADRPVLIVRGQANLLDDSAVGDLDRVRLLLVELETKQDIAQLRSEEHTSELQSLMRISYAVFCLQNNKIYSNQILTTRTQQR